MENEFSFLLEILWLVNSLSVQWLLENEFLLFSSQFNAILLENDFSGDRYFVESLHRWFQTIILRKCYSVENLERWFQSIIFRESYFVENLDSLIAVQILVQISSVAFSSNSSSL